MIANEDQLHNHQLITQLYSVCRVVLITLGEGCMGKLMRAIDADRIEKAYSAVSGLFFTSFRYLHNYIFLHRSTFKNLATSFYVTS